MLSRCGNLWYRKSYFPAITYGEMAEQIPINPALLVWARQRAGLSLDAAAQKLKRIADWEAGVSAPTYPQLEALRSEEHTSELQSRENLVCRLLLEKKNEKSNV